AGIYIINDRYDPTAKMTWLVIISLIPIVGVLFYWTITNDFGHRRFKKKLTRMTENSRQLLQQDPETLLKLKLENPAVASLAHYASSINSHPVFDETELTYYPSGRKMWEALLEELEQAEEYIFMEYFIIGEGYMWGKILDILERKAQEGVEVRLMYDGSCAFTTLPYTYDKKVRELGIKCKMFSKIVPFLRTTYNYRDHRKIAVIDGQTAFTGGINMADEYIGETIVYGHWKDSGIMVKGRAVQSFKLMFLQMWNAEEAKEDFGSYMESSPEPAPDAQGYAMPYGENPLLSDKLARNVYIDMLNRAQNYVHIITPYLVLDGDLEAAFQLCARRGVDVKLIIPGIPDKFIPYAMAKSHYEFLIENGIQIYEYDPGFAHSKTIVCDGREAVVGTINFDYRSLYHHFECGVFMLDSPAVADVEQDFQDTLRRCTNITLEKAKSRHPGYKITGWIMKIFAPLF
ncbi:MAG: cardiolipin synthase, partial [Erysipelotrichaceae bacterium]|nr:cardiolipin synthase [Erysipelotrichaceae bacterium]